MSDEYYSQFESYPGLSLDSNLLGISHPKFGRTYTLYYWYDPEYGACAKIRLPIALEFSVSRNNLASNNKCNLKLYNLSKKTRDLMFQDELDIGVPFDAKKLAKFGNFYRTDTSDDPTNKQHSKLKNRIELWAGYSSTSTEWLIFSGYVLSSYSYRSGVDWITEISGYTTNLRDPSSYFCFTANKGMSKADVINKIGNQLLGVETTNFDPMYNEQFLEKDEVYMGTAQEILTEHLGYKPYVDNECLNVLSDETILLNKPSIINSKSGLLASPRRTQNGVKISMIFEPALRVGNIVALGAEREVTYNDCQFSVSGFVHKGTISANKDSSTTTELELWKGQPGFFRTCESKAVGTKPLKNVEIYEGGSGGNIRNLSFA